MTISATSGRRNWGFESDIERRVMQGAHREIRDGREPDEGGTFEIASP